MNNKISRALIHIHTQRDQQKQETARISKSQTFVS